MHLPYAHSSLTEDTYKNQVHSATLGGKKSLILIYFKG